MAAIDTAFPRRHQVNLDLPDLAATRQLAISLARSVRAGDIIALKGPLGAGKTCFARFFIEASGVTEEVPSPTFNLVQTYPLQNGSAEAIWHYDLYRIEAPEDVWELDIEDAFETGISLIEWPERLGNLLPERHIEIALSIGDSPGVRHATLSVPAEFSDRLSDIETSFGTQA